MQKQNLILLHGALGSSRSFEQLIPYLSDHFNLIVPDLKFHGERAEGGSGFTMEDLVNDFEGILQTEQIHSANVFGFSMGGYVALALAVQKPQYFKKIMTLGTKLDWNLAQAKKESKMLNPDKIQEKVPQFASHLKSMHGQNWMDLCRQTAAMMSDLVANPILTTRTISPLDIPVRLGLGDQDNMVGLQETVAFYKALKKGELEVFPNCPHPLEKVDTQFLARSIIDFCN